MNKESPANEGLNFKLDIGFNKLAWQAGLICTLAGSNTIDATNTSSYLKDVTAEIASRAKAALAPQLAFARV